MSPKRKNSIAPKVEGPLDKVSQKAENDSVQLPAIKAESTSSTSGDGSSVHSGPCDETASPRMTRWNNPCLACIEHLINWLPSDEGVMFCEEGNDNGTCARCENAGLECKSSRGALKKSATRLHTALSKSIRDPDSIKPMQAKVRENLKSDKDRELEDNRDRAIGEIGDKMGLFLKGMCRDHKLKGFQRGMDLACMTVKDCKGSCSSLLRGCNMGTRVTMYIVQGEDEEEEEPAMPAYNGKPKAAKA